MRSHLFSTMPNYLKSIFRSIGFKRMRHSAASEPTMDLELMYSGRSFNGEQRFYIHSSEILKCKMNIGIYLPPKAVKENTRCPVLYFLNNRTDSHETFLRKSAFQKFAAELEICAVSPDTSPRDVDVPSDNNLGTGSSFYMDATQEPWKKHYQMYTYVTRELIELVNQNFPAIKDRQSISGLSMGGYGALVCALRNPGLYRSVSAFAPVCNPMKSGTGQKALEAYIGKNTEEWKKWDPCALVSNYAGDSVEILIDQGTSDPNLKEKELLPENFIRASAKNNRVQTIYKERNGYDQSLYFVTTFVDEHMKYHAKFLNSD